VTRLALAAAAIILGCNPKSGEATASTVGSAASTASTSTSSSTSASTSVSAITGTGTGTKVIEADGETDALSLIRTTRLQTKGRTLVVYVGATWCEPCKRFKAEIASGRLDARLGKVTFLAFDADRDVDRLAAAGYTFRFVPFVALPGADGHPTDSQQATGKGSAAWQELLGKLDTWQRGGEAH
jgi:thiol-disulfide isomerase/thioredoxin